MLQDNDPKLQLLSNQKMNACIKEIADLCGISKNLSIHVARHTFATTETLTNGVPNESVSRLLGHKNILSNRHYARIVDKKVGDNMHLFSKNRELIITHNLNMNCFFTIGSLSLENLKETQEVQSSSQLGCLVSSKVSRVKEGIELFI